MIPGRGGDDSSLFLLPREAGEEVDRASSFKNPSGHEIFMLDEDLSIEELI